MSRLIDLEDRLECAIRHINTALDIDTWAQHLAVESMRMRIAQMKGKQPGIIIRCKDCKHYNAGFECLIEGYGIERDEDWFCADAERRTDGL